MNKVACGTLLIAEPFMKDPNFQRSVVLICEHDPSGSFGIIVNKITKDNIGDYMPEYEHVKMPVFDGGPVGKDQMHFLHTRPDLIEGGREVGERIYWGGDFKTAIEGVESNEILKNEIRFYLGYAGWEEKQLNGELDEKSWLITPAHVSIVFYKNPSQIWKESIRQLGKDFHPIMNYPLDPSYN